MTVSLMSRWRPGAVLAAVVLGAGCGSPITESPAAPTATVTSVAAADTVAASTVTPLSQSEESAASTSSIPADPGGHWCPAWATDQTCGDGVRDLIDLIHSSVDGGMYGFILKPVGADPLIAVSADTPFYPASAIKALHLAHATLWLDQHGTDIASPIPVYHASCSGTGGHTELPLSLALKRMMIASDNQITNAVQDFFGAEALNATAASLGMSATGLHHRFGCGGPANNPSNTTTARDLASLFEAMLDGDFSSAATEFFIDSLLDMTHQVAGASNSATGAVTVRGKAGWYGTTLTIGGIIVDNATSDLYVFAAFVEGARSHEPGFTIERVIFELLDAISEK